MVVYLRPLAIPSGTRNKQAGIGVTFLEIDIRTPSLLANKLFTIESRKAVPIHCMYISVVT